MTIFCNSGTFTGGSSDQKTDSFSMPHMQAPGAMRSGECEGNGNSIPREIKRSPKCCIRQTSDSPAVWAVAPFCCIHYRRSGRFLALQKHYKSHTNGAIIISLQRPWFTVSRFCASSSKKYGPNILCPNTAHQIITRVLCSDICMTSGHLNPRKDLYVR